MTIAEQVKILDDREAAKISALPNGGLEKYDFLTVKDLGYKPNVIQKAKFECYPLDKVFNKGLGEIHKKEELLQILNIRVKSS